MKVRNILLSAGVASLMWGCASDEPEIMTVPETGGITITAYATDLMPQIVTSRAVGPEKRAEEKEIKTLHLFFFDKNGNPLKPVNPAIFDFYKKVTVGEGQQPAQNMPSGAFENQSTLTDVTVVAVANIDGDKFRTENTPDGDIVNGSPISKDVEVTIKHVNDLKNWIYRAKEWRDDISKLPAAGMPMFGILEGQVDLSKEQAAVAIPMEALMARVDVNIKLDANQTSHDHLFPQLKITSYGVENMPSAVPFWIDENNTDYTTDVERGLGLSQPKLIDVSEDHEVMLDGQEAQSFSYYTYENIQKGMSSDDYTYPKGVDPKDESAIQRWKPLLAPNVDGVDIASKLIMHGHYVTDQELQYDAQFTVYLGENTYDNFEVRRNRAYINNIVIKGLDYVRQNPMVYTFDGRVNVVSDNPIYISVVGERRIDAHATALPIDVYFTRVEEGRVDGRHSHVEFEILPDESGEIPNWLRLEKVPARTMMPGYDGVNFPNDDATARQPGTGARPYFTTDLVTTTLVANTKVSIGNDVPVGSDMDGGSRSRVYVYIDENTDVNAPGYGDRTATLRMYYNDETNPENDRVRTIEIDQRGLVHVVANHPSQTAVIDVWMEYYEEYLDHADPLDRHEEPTELYSGLAWGLDGKTTKYAWSFSGGNGGFQNSEQVYTNGQDMTDWVIEHSNAQSLSDLRMDDKKTKPASAFHYCVSKNKRNSDGTRAGNNWYMPGIRELEVALTERYSTFPEFQGGIYWSASAGKNGNNENTSRARATSVLSNGGYMESGSNTADGSRPRTQANRVRAFYKP